MRSSCHGCCSLIPLPLITLCMLFELRSPSLRPQSPTFWHQGLVLWKIIFPRTSGAGDGFRMIQGHCIYCEIYFYYYYINSISDHQELWSWRFGTPCLRCSTCAWDRFPGNRSGRATHHFVVFNLETLAKQHFRNTLLVLSVVSLWQFCWLFYCMKNLDATALGFIIRVGLSKVIAL